MLPYALLKIQRLVHACACVDSGAISSELSSPANATRLHTVTFAPHADFYAFAYISLFNLRRVDLTFSHAINVRTGPVRKDAGAPVRLHFCKSTRR